MNLDLWCCYYVCVCGGGGVNDLTWHVWMVESKSWWRGVGGSEAIWCSKFLRWALLHWYCNLFVCWCSWCVHCMLSLSVSAMWVGYISPQHVTLTSNWFMVVLSLYHVGLYSGGSRGEGGWPPIPKLNCLNIDQIYQKISEFDTQMLLSWGTTLINLECQAPIYFWNRTPFFVKILDPPLLYRHCYTLIAGMF